MTGYQGGALEAIVVRILRREFAVAMRLDAAGPVAPITAPRVPCQLYVHVPFCESLCPFCSFHRVEYREDKSRSYFKSVQRELRLYRDRGFQFRDVSIGGGTPTVNPGELLETIRLIRSFWDIRSLSVETHPNDLTPHVLDGLQSARVDRLSVGVQSFDDVLLRAMGRVHAHESAAAIVGRLAAARGRFATLNVDMIFNFAGQSVQSLERDLAILRELAVDQISFYPLMTAPSAARRMQGSLGAADPARRIALYQQILAGLRPHYEPSSAWCFTRASAQSIARPIDEYITQSDDYVGVGSGAFSYVDGRLYSTTFSLNRYRALIEGGASGVTGCRTFTRKQRMRYDLLVKLFGLALPYAYIDAKYGRSFRWRMSPELTALRVSGLTRHDPDAIRLTDRGMAVWIVMMAEFFTAVNAFRDQMRRHIRLEWPGPSASRPTAIAPRRFAS